MAELERRRQARLLEVLTLGITALTILLATAAVTAVLEPGNALWENLRSGVGLALGVVLAYPVLKWRARRKRYRRGSPQGHG